MPATPAQVDAVRRFNRFYTRRIGVLQEGLLDSKYSLTEVRVMYELAHRDGIGSTELAAELGLDRGYLSRILKRFRAAGLLVHKPMPGDRRRQRLGLTAKGRRVFAPLDKASRLQVEAMLGALDSQGRQHLLSALDTVERTLSTGAAIEATTTAPTPTAPVILRTHRPGDLGWIVQRHGELYFREYGYDERFEAVVAGIVSAFVQHLDPERERCWIAAREGERLGSVALVAKSRTVAKLRILLVEPAARGMGLGRRLVDECVRFAREAGYRKVVLWTQGELDAARHIYAAVGFRKVAETRYDDFGKRGLTAETWELKL